jgi:ABC-type methionine transport system ATPase subunit
MHSRTVKFEYPLKSVNAPVVSSIVKQFDVAPNILSANIDPRTGGWLVVELIGEIDNIDQALAWTKENGITVSDYV